MVDGILANPRNPVNHDLWLTGRFSTSRQPSLFLSLHVTMTSKGTIVTMLGPARVPKIIPM